MLKVNNNDIVSNFDSVQQLEDYFNEFPNELQFNDDKDLTMRQKVHRLNKRYKIPGYRIIGVGENIYQISKDYVRKPKIKDELESLRERITLLENIIDDLKNK